jgi:hypothetical protein
MRKSFIEESSNSKTRTKEKEILEEQRVVRIGRYFNKERRSLEILAKKILMVDLNNP